MNFVFRVDASIQMGTGHVMRCLTLADALKNRGAECYFICREHSGNLIGLITPIFLKVIASVIRKIGVYCSCAKKACATSVGHYRQIRLNRLPWV